ncbi:MAG: hypothetical protein LBR48_07160 [Dysgonamonadaceae bacterium]|jgi:hypothetical protein|nr:hypothetical protein [Dysgonamonadaceae bacterium]
MKNSLFIIIIGVALGFFSCSDQTAIYKDYVVPNGLVYPGPALNPIAYPGDNRIQITWSRGTDPRVKTAKIFWNNYTDSVELTVPAGVDLVSYTISPIAENTYSFMIHTYDAQGNKSIPVEVLGTVYGNNYKDMLRNRLLKSTSYDGQDLVLKWGSAEDTEVGIQLNYFDNGGAKSLTVEPDETETVLPSFDLSKPITYSTTHKPDSLSIDLLQATTVEKTLTVVSGVEISKADWADSRLPGDIGINGSYPLNRLWNGNTGDFMHSADVTACPFTVTWDMGLATQLERMKLWPRPDNDDRWNKGQPRLFEIYGSLNPNPDGSLDSSWTLLGSFECVQPSGNGTKNPYEAPTTDDIALSNSGLDFDFPGSAGNPNTWVRYIRLRSLENFHISETPRLLLAEITFWGKAVK